MKCSSLNCSRGIGLVSYRRQVTTWFERLFAETRSNALCNISALELEDLWTFRPRAFACPCSPLVSILEAEDSYNSVIIQRRVALLN
jgi:hypothetical protein